MSDKEAQLQGPNFHELDEHLQNSESGRFFNAEPETTVVDTSHEFIANRLTPAERREAQADLAQRARQIFLGAKRAEEALLSIADEVHFSTMRGITNTFRYEDADGGIHNLRLKLNAFGTQDDLEVVEVSGEGAHMDTQERPLLRLAGSSKEHGGYYTLAHYRDRETPEDTKIELLAAVLDTAEQQLTFPDGFRLGSKHQWQRWAKAGGQEYRSGPYEPPKRPPTLEEVINGVSDEDRGEPSA